MDCFISGNDAAIGQFTYVYNYLRLKIAPKTIAQSTEVLAVIFRLGQWTT